MNFVQVDVPEGAHAGRLFVGVVGLLFVARHLGRNENLLGTASRPETHLRQKLLDSRSARVHSSQFRFQLRKATFLFFSLSEIFYLLAPARNDKTLRFL